MYKKDEYTLNLEETLKKFMMPIKDIPFSIVIEVLTGFKVIKFESTKNKQILQKLINGAEVAGREAAKVGIVADRPNEAGNRIEPYVIDALRKNEFSAQTPKTISGKSKAAGYPDIEIQHKSGWNGYLDCKTFSPKSKDSAFRAFYLSPSQDPKIIRDAVHLLLSFQLKLKNNKYVPISWHLYDLHELKVNIKHEFNASNKELYNPKYLLAEGNI